MKNLLVSLWRDDSGAELTEYSLVLGVMTLGLIAAAVLFRGQIATLFSNIGTDLQAAP